MVALLEGAEFGFDAEEFTDEVVEVGRDFDEECGGRFEGEVGGVLADGEEAGVEFRRGFSQRGEELRVETDQAIAGVEILKGESEGERKDAIVHEVEREAGGPPVCIFSDGVIWEMANAVSRTMTGSMGWR